MTATALRIGVVTVDPSTTKNAEDLGVRGFTTGDVPADWRAVVAEQNRRGGLIGRKVEVYFHLISLTSSNFAADIQAACTKFTQDQPVYVLFSDLIFDDGLAACARKANLPLIYGQASVDQPTLLSQGVLAISGGPSLNRLATTYVDGLAGSGFLTAKSTIGLIRTDNARYASVQKTSFDPAMKRNGLTLSQTALVAPVNDGDYGRLTSQLQAAVLKFRAAGVDRVLYLTVNATEPLLFMTSADSQNYRPLYGFTTANYPSVQEGSAPKAQLKDAQNVGWSQFGDVSEARDPGLTAKQKQCLATMKAGGQVPQARPEKLIMMIICDAFSLFTTVQTNLAVPVDGQRFIAGVESLGATQTPTATFTARFGAGRRDGAASYRLSRWDSGCGCFAYSGPLRTMS